MQYLKFMLKIWLFMQASVLVTVLWSVLYIFDVLKLGLKEATWLSLASVVYNAFPFAVVSGILTLIKWSLEDPDDSAKSGK